MAQFNNATLKVYQARQQGNLMASYSEHQSTFATKPSAIILHRKIDPLFNHIEVKEKS